MRLTPFLLACGLISASVHTHANAQAFAAEASASDAAALAASDKRPVAEIDVTQPHIKAAIQKAKKSVGELLKVEASKNPRYKDFGARVLIREGNNEEYVWLMPFEKDGNGYIGFVNTATTQLKKVQFGMNHRFKREDIMDWMYTDTSTRTMHGQFIICAQMMKDSPEDAPLMKKRYGLDCKK